MLPTKSRPPTTVIPAHDCTSPGRPKAHFNLSFGTSAADSPGDDWNRAFERFCPNPFQTGCDVSIENVEFDRHIAFAAGSIVKRSPSDFPLANSASARRSAVVRPCVIDTIDPNSSTSRIRCGVIRSEEHTSELQSQSNLVCRLLLEKKKNSPTQPVLCLSCASDGASASRFNPKHYMQASDTVASPYLLPTTRCSVACSTMRNNTITS